MYYEFFGLRANPFQPAPSAEFFFASRGHREALAALQWGLSDPTGLVLLTGDVGTGKTTVIRELFSRETRDVRTALVSNPRISFDSLLESILRQINVDAPEGRASMLEALTQASELNRVVVVIDEAQQLSDEALEEFRLLSNSSPGRLQLMLVGQPELLERLASPRLRQLNQRIAIRAVLNPLQVGETIAYLEHRIRAAGGEIRRIFNRSALRAVARISEGIPRRVNILSHNAMLSAYSAGSRRVRPKHVLAAEREYDHTSSLRATPAQKSTIWARSLPPALLLALGIVLIVLHHSTAKTEAERPTAVAHEPVHTIVTGRAEPSAAPSIAIPRPEESADAQPPLPASASSAAMPAPVLSANAAADSRPQPPPAAAQEPDQKAVPQNDAGALAPMNAEQTDEIVVRTGDTLSAIAERYSDGSGRIDLKQLIAANPEIKNANLIYPGEKVRLSPK